MIASGFAVLFALLAPAPLPEVAGVVVGPSGAPVPGALIIVRDSARGMTHMAVADARGNFRVRAPVDEGTPVTASTQDGTLSGSVRAGTAASHRVVLARAPEPTRLASSAAWLAKLPDNETRRRFILDCTGCHQFDDSRAFKNGTPRTASQWSEDIQRMLGYGGPRSNFPVISTWAEDPAAAAWLGRAVATAAPTATTRPVASDYQVTEFDFPVPQDLPHDVAVEQDGRVVVTGMFSHAMFRLTPASGAFERIAIPVERANPRAVELDAEGNWWVLLGGPAKIGRYVPRDGSWRFFDIGMYPHSIAVASPDEVWFNGHFSRDPEQVGRARLSTGAVEVFDLPGHPTLRTVPGGPIPYEQRLGPDGTVWVSELQGNRLIAFDPRTRTSRTFTLPTSWSGPRRFDVAPDGTVWIPAYAANLLVKLDPATGRFTEIPMPVEGATPYIARVDSRSGQVWIGTSAADAVFRYDPRTGRFADYPLPSRGAMVRHMAIDEARGEVWLAYGASPGRIPAKIARIRTR